MQDITETQVWCPSIYQIRDRALWNREPLQPIRIRLLSSFSNPLKKKLILPDDSYVNVETDILKEPHNNLHKKINIPKLSMGCATTSRTLPELQSNSNGQN